MAHQMGLLKIVLGTKQIVTTRWYNLSETSYEDSSDKTTIQASSNFQTNIPYSSDYLYVVNPTKSTTLKTPDSDTRKWTLAANSQVTSGKYKEVTVTANKDFLYKGWIISYAGSLQTFNKGTKAGKYKLEVYGGQGGDGYEWNASATSAIVADAGGKGGYTYGEVTLTASQTLYVCTGEKGSVAGRIANVKAAGGYNGGGSGGTEQSETVPESASGGGGATHIATTKRSDGQLKNYYSYQNEVLIVAGGGGGASGTFPEGWVETNGNPSSGNWSSWNVYGLDGKTNTAAPCYGGDGGSTGAGTRTNSYTTAGVASGGSSTYFGVGQNGFVGTTGNYGGIGGGGGGWFGGTCTSSYNNALAAAGAGGSGHVHSSLENPGGTIGYNSGNGWARISSTFEW